MGDTFQHLNMRASSPDTAQSAIESAAMTEPLHAVAPIAPRSTAFPPTVLRRKPNAASASRGCSAGEPIVLTSKTFDKHVERNDMAVIVDFWAPWCGPCRAMAPIFDRAAKELEPRARFAKVNVDEEPAIASRFGIRGIPTLIAFEKGKVAKQHAGLVDLEFLRRLVRSGAGAAFHRSLRFFSINCEIFS